MSQGGAGVLESSTVGTVCITYLPPSILGVKFHMRLQVHAVGRRQRSRSGARASVGSGTSISTWKFSLLVHDQLPGSLLQHLSSLISGPSRGSQPLPDTRPCLTHAHSSDRLEAQGSL